MAVFFDLDDDDDCASHSRSCEGTAWTGHGPETSPHQCQLRTISQESTGTGDRISIAKNAQGELLGTNKLAAALTCYPIALSLSSHLDLNDLHALAAACRSVHACLTQYAGQLKAHSLRCVHDGRPVLAEALAAQRDGPPRSPYTPETFGATILPLGPPTWHTETQQAAAVAGARLQPEGLYASLGVSSKISSCARDLVAPCRRCGTVVCRNCATKSPSNARLKERFRRLCKTCLDAPIEAHLQGLSSLDDDFDGPPGSSASSVRSERSFSGSSASSPGPALEDRGCQRDHHQTFTSSAFLRNPCTCESRGVFLCSPCGQNLRAADTTYKRVWTWRSRYSTHIGGGLGTGLGEGNQGQKCGRGEDCLESGGKAVCWVEIDCSEGKAHEGHREYDRLGSSRVSTPDSSSGSNKPGYLQQEIEGIGGVVKKKVKKRVKVGATVWEYEDERESGKYLEREATGAARSWCGWCGRVCLGGKDREDSA